MADTRNNAPRHPNALGLLRALVGDWVFLPAETRATQEFLDKNGFLIVRVLKDWKQVGLNRAGHRAFTDLAKLISKDNPTLERAVQYSDFKDKLFSLAAMAHEGADTTALDHSDVEKLDAGITEWLKENAVSRTVIVPCAITPWPSPRFSIGPVRFIFLEDVKTSELFPRDETWKFDEEQFSKYLKETADRDGNWLAAVDVDGCATLKAIEIGQLAVDLAITGIQVSAPRSGVKTMARINKMRGRAFETTITLRDGNYGWGHSNKSPGLSIGNGYMQEIQRVAQRTFTSVGNRVAGFTSGQFGLPNIEGAWCDAAYWLHEGLSESVDSISVAKLETALEVLLGAESTQGSEAKILKALHTFFGLSPEQPITPGSDMTTKQYAKEFVTGRSRVLHGTLSTLSSNLAELRDSLEYMGTTLVRSMAIEIDEYLAAGESKDDVGVFLDWVRAIRDQRKQTANG
jgi:hypothetical protein